MGAGIFPAGAGGCGRDPVLPPSAPISAVRTPRALQYDPVTKTFLKNDDGTMPDVDPTDQKVALALFIEAGSIRGVEDQGNNFRKRLTRVDPKKAQNIVEDEAQSCLSVLLAAKDILLVSATVDTSVRGRAIISVKYFNLRDPAYNPNNPDITPSLLQAALAI